MLQLDTCFNLMRSMVPSQRLTRSGFSHKGCPARTLYSQRLPLRPAQRPHLNTVSAYASLPVRTLPGGAHAIGSYGAARSKGGGFVRRLVTV